MQKGTSQSLSICSTSQEINPFYGRTSRFIIAFVRAFHGHNLVTQIQSISPYLICCKTNYNILPSMPKSSKYTHILWDIPPNTLPASWYYLAFPWSKWRQLWNMPDSAASDLAEVHTDQSSNTDVQHYPCTNLGTCCNWLMWKINVLPWSPFS
jgi:hypothetical protein